MTTTTDEPTYPRRTFFLLNGSMLTLDIVIIGLVGWAASPAGQSHVENDTKLSTTIAAGLVRTSLWSYHFSSLIYVVQTSLSAIYIMILFGLMFFAPRITVPTLARILINFLVIVPAYALSVSWLGK